MASAWSRTAPVAMALAPVGALFGLTAAQRGWSPVDVLVVSVFGFTGSGQFACMQLLSSGVASGAMFAIIAAINLRYIPMSVTAAQGVTGSKAWRAVLAHFVSDESYATEVRSDRSRERARIRLAIAVYWAASTTLGALCGRAVPMEAAKTLASALFPASALLIALSVLQIKAFWSAEGRRAARVVGAAGAVALLSILVLGPRYFWFPSVALGVVLGARRGSAERIR